MVSRTALLSFRAPNSAPSIIISWEYIHVSQGRQRACIHTKHVLRTCVASAWTQSYLFLTRWMKWTLQKPHRRMRCKLRCRSLHQFFVFRRLAVWHLSSDPNGSLILCREASFVRLLSLLQVSLAFFFTTREGADTSQYLATFYTLLFHGAHGHRRLSRVCSLGHHVD